MRFKDPHFFLFLLVWIPMVWIYLRRLHRDSESVRFSDVSLLRAAGHSFWTRARHLLFVFRMAAVGCLVVALARPQKGSTHEEVITHGVDIVLVLDISYSMRALDFKPQNRLHVAKETIKEFIGKREHDRIGLVVFAKRSFTKCPLTLDYSILTQFVDEIDFGDFGDGTAIGTAVATAANRLKDSDAKSKVIILSTDGANNAGDIAPLTAAKAAAELGIKIYTVGVGKEGNVPYPFQIVDRRTGRVVDTRVRMMPSDLDEQALVDIADASGGSFFRAHNPQRLREIYEKINSLEKTEIKTKSYTTFTEHFFPWLLIGTGLILLELLLANTRFRTLP